MRRPLRSILLISVILGLFVLYGCWRWQNNPIKPRTQTVYTYYLPILAKPRGLYGKGLASASGGLYAQELNASWWYQWSWCDQPGCIPMLRDWELPPSCPPIILVGNEPNSREPYGHSMEPDVAANVSHQIRRGCPDSWLVVGNVALPSFLGLSGIEWVKQYMDHNGEHDQLGVHCYISPNGNVLSCEKALGDFVQAFPGVPECVTEWGTYNRQPDLFADYLSYITQNFDCYAVFTDYDVHWQTYGYDLNMVTADGRLNSYGLIYQGVKTEP